MLLVNTLQQPSRTMMLHLVKIPLLMVLLTGLFFFFFSIFFSAHLGTEFEVGKVRVSPPFFFYLHSNLYSKIHPLSFLLRWLSLSFLLSFCGSNVVIFTIFFSSSVFRLFHSAFIAIAHCHLLFGKSSFPSLPETFLSSSVCLTPFFHLSFCVTLISVYINRVFFFFFFFLICFLAIAIVPKSEGASATANSDSLFD